DRAGHPGPAAGCGPRPAGYPARLGGDLAEHDRPVGTARSRSCRDRMSTAETAEFSPTWLALREPADAAARAPERVQALGRDLATVTRRVIRDLGCGTGSMGGWLAARLPGPQHWVLYDRDSTLLDHARTHMASAAADGAPVTVETRRCDVTALTAAELS